MKQDVLIDIEGTYSTDDGDDRIELTTIGSFTRLVDSYYITYRESEATGMEGIISTVKIEGDQKITLIRRGTQQSRLILEKGKRHHCHYDTGFGEMMIGIFAESIVSSLKENGGKIHFKYTLDINSDIISRNEVNITVREAGSNQC